MLTSKLYVRVDLRTAVPTKDPLFLVLIGDHRSGLSVTNPDAGTGQLSRLYRPNIVSM